MPHRPPSRTNGIRFHRLRLELTQAQLARMVGVGQKAVSFWESGRATPPPERLARLAEVLEIHEDLLLKAIDRRHERHVDHGKLVKAAAKTKRPARYWMKEPETPI